MERIFISFNWTIGTILLAVGLLFPLLDDMFLTGMVRKEAEQVVASLVRIQERHYQLNEKFVLFGPGEMPAEIQKESGQDLGAKRDFNYDVRIDGDGALVVRAQVVEKKVRSGALPPLIYYYRKLPGGQVERVWQSLSGKKPGLF